MGHLRLKDLPRSRKWRQVVALIEGGADAPQVANATIDAAEKALSVAAEDPGLVETVWLLTQLPVAARSDDFVRALRAVGLEVSAAPSLMEIVGAFSDAIDSRVAGQVRRTDLGEMAQMAAVETLSKVVGARTENLFGTTTTDVQNALAGIGTRVQFSSLARDFFGRFTERCMGYFLSRAYADNVGEGRRFATLAEVDSFTSALRVHCQEASAVLAQPAFADALKVHCREASLIVEAFSGGWFTKTNWEKKGITRQDAGGFAHVAMQKLCAELKAGAPPDAS
jgi:hypothetical protein